MQEATVERLLNNLFVLRGHIRTANIKISALEEILKELKPVHYERYRQLAREFESAPNLSYSLEDVEGLRKALLQDRS
jgi:hypothetical protein